MTGRPTAHAVARDDLAKARRDLDRVLDRARAAGPLVSLAASRYWSETLMLMHGRNLPTQTEMIRRTSALVDLIVDRAMWPR